MVDLGARAPEGLAYDATCARVVDLGVGDAECVVLAPRKTAYRDAPCVATVFRGAPEDAMDVVKGSLAAETFALALALVMFATAAAGQAGAREESPHESLARDAQNAPIAFRVLWDATPEDIAPTPAPNASDLHYAVTTVNQTTCLYRVAPDERATQVVCTVGDPDATAGVTVQGGGRMALLYWLSPERLAYAWVHLESGAILRRGEVQGASGPGAVSLDALLVVPIDQGAALWVVDLMGDARARITPPYGRFHVPPSTPWLDDELIASLEVGGAFATVALDPRLALREPRERVLPRSAP
jgi:hypothetical protein